MIGLKTFIAIYLFGGITFLPLLLLAFIHFTAKPKEDKRRQRPAANALLADEIEPEFKSGAIEEKKGVDVFKKGWITVTNRYFYHQTELLESENTDATVPTRDKLKKKHRFFGILKHGNLFLYRDESNQSSVSQVVVLKNSFVTIWPRNSEDELLDASLFTKRTCIAILKNNVVHLGDDGKLKFREGGLMDKFFIYVDNNVEKEDWYFQLINASKVAESTGDPLDPNVSATTAHFRTRDMLYLIQTLNSTEGQLSTKWLNALIGRLFLSWQQTEMLSQVLREKIHKKLTKINKPGFLDDFKIENVDVGTSTPMFTHPRLEELTPEGLMKIGLNMSYKGNLSLIISTKMNINLGSRFKTREVNIELAITVKEIKGPMVIMIKPPPSNRLWYSFEIEPHIDLDIEPVVSTRQLSYNMVTKAIKSKFQEAIKESLVMPYMDDIVFYKTTEELYRGGIWEQNRPKHPIRQDSVSETDKRIPGAESTEEVPENSTDDSKNGSNSIISRSTNSSIQSDDSTGLDVQSSPPRRRSTEESIISGLDNTIEPPTRDGNDSTIKTRTLQKVETFKTLLKTHSDNTIDSSEPYDSNGSSSPTLRGKRESTMSLISDEASASKKYIQTGFKKFGRWYKDTVNSSTKDLDVGQPDTSITHPPEMISNRRTLPKNKDRVASATHAGIASEVSGSGAAEMFANRSRTRATSSESGSSSPVNNNFKFNNSAANMPSPPMRFTSELHGFPQEFFEKDKEDGVVVKNDYPLKAPDTVDPLAPETPTAKAGPLDDEEQQDEFKENKPLGSLGVQENDAFERGNSHENEQVLIQSTLRKTMAIKGERVDLQSLNRKRPVPPPPVTIEEKEIHLTTISAVKEGEPATSPADVPPLPPR